MGQSNTKRLVERSAVEGAVNFGANGVKADVIAESTSAAGVTIDGVLCKDNAVTASGGFTGELTGNTVGLHAGNVAVGAGTFLLGVAALNASGSTQANAIANAAITSPITIVAAADNAKGVALPTPSAGDIRLIKTTVAGSTLKIYPQSNGQINAEGANNAYTTAQAGCVLLFAANATQWYTVPLVSS